MASDEQGPQGLAENNEDGIVVEFGFGGVTLEPSGNGLLTVTLNGVSTFVDPAWFDRAIADGIFNNPHPAVAAQMDGDSILDLAEAPDLHIIGELDDAQHPKFSAKDGMPFTPFENSLVKLLNYESVDAACSTPDFILAHFLSDVLVNLKHMVDEREKWFGRGTGIETIEATFDLYVDGYTIRSTGTVGEMLVTSPEGLSATIQTKQLTAFLDRRLTPGESDRNIEPGT